MEGLREGVSEREGVRGSEKEVRRGSERLMKPYPPLTVFALLRKDMSPQ